MPGADPRRWYSGRRRAGGSILRGRSRARGCRAADRGPAAGLARDPRAGASLFGPHVDDVRRAAAGVAVAARHLGRLLLREGSLHLAQPRGEVDRGRVCAHRVAHPLPGCVLSKFSPDRSSVSAWRRSRVRTKVSLGSRRLHKTATSIFFVLDASRLRRDPSLRRWRVGSSIPAGLDLELASRRRLTTGKQRRDRTPWGSPRLSRVSFMSRIRRRRSWGRAFACHEQRLVKRLQPRGTQRLRRREGSPVWRTPRRRWTRRLIVRRRPSRGHADRRRLHGGDGRCRLGAHAATASRDGAPLWRLAAHRRASCYPVVRREAHPRALTPVRRSARRKLPHDRHKRAPPLVGRDHASHRRPRAASLGGGALACGRVLPRDPRRPVHRGAAGPALPLQLLDRAHRHGGDRDRHHQSPFHPDQVRQQGRRPHQRAAGAPATSASSPRRRGCSSS